MNSELRIMNYQLGRGAKALRCTNYELCYMASSVKLVVYRQGQYQLDGLPALNYELTGKGNYELGCRNV